MTKIDKNNKTVPSISEQLQLNNLLRGNAEALRLETRNSIYFSSNLWSVNMKSKYCFRSILALIKQFPILN